MSNSERLFRLSEVKESISKKQYSENYPSRMKNGDVHCSCGGSLLLYCDGDEQYHMRCISCGIQWGLSGIKSIKEAWKIYEEVTAEYNKKTEKRKYSLEI